MNGKTDAMTYSFDQLTKAPLEIDALYIGGQSKNKSSEVLSKLLPLTCNSGGFRKTKIKNTDLFAYVVIYTTMGEAEWPDFFDVENGIFRYYGDNRRPGHELHDTPQHGNLILRDVFQWLNSQTDLKKIPPFLIFKKEKGYNVRFLGLAVPGNSNLHQNQELVSFWRTLGNERFQNYEAYFTVLDTKGDSISKEWLQARIDGDPDSDRLAPQAWRSFMKKGREGIAPLKSKRNIRYPPKKEQLPSDESDHVMLQIIRDRYASFPQDFELCATRILELMDQNFVRMDVTRPWRDGGRDAVGFYRIGSGEGSITIDCAMEAKLYGDNHAVGVKEMSRLISRIRYRQFGVLVTTGFIDRQAYMEVKADGHPIMIITGMDIINILKSCQISTNEALKAWLDSIEKGEAMIDQQD